MTTDLEDRLRSDLPRLADVLTSPTDGAGSAEGIGPSGDAAGGGELVPITNDALASRRSTWLRVAALVLVLAVAAVVVSRLDDRGSTTVAGSPPPGALDTWKGLSPMPLSPREDATSVWTGSEWLVFGGRQGDLALDDSAAYDPATDTWRRLAVNPTMHPGAQAVWTGHVAVVLATGGGWIYDPAVDTWTELPQQSALPGGSVVGGGGAWTGSEVVTVGVTFTGSQVAIVARTLDPTRPAWGAEVATPPLASSLDAIGAIAGTWWDGSRVQVWLTTGDGWAYDPATGTWSALPALRVLGTDAETTLSIAGSGTRTYALAYTSTSGGATGQLAVFDGLGWTLVGDPQAWPSGDAAAQLTMAGDVPVVFSSQRPPQAIDPATGALRSLGPIGSSPPGPISDGLGRTVVWTGHELLVAGGRDTTFEAGASGVPGPLTAAAASLSASHD